MTQRRTVGRTVGRVYEDDDFRYNEAGATATTRARGPTVTLGSVVLCALVAAAVALGTGLSSLASPAGADARALASRVTSVSASSTRWPRRSPRRAKSAAKPAKLDKPAARELAFVAGGGAARWPRRRRGAGREDAKPATRTRSTRKRTRRVEDRPQDADGRALRARREGGGSRRRRRLRLREGGGDERAENGRAHRRVRGVCARDAPLNATWSDRFRRWKKKRIAASRAGGQVLVSESDVEAEAGRARHGRPRRGVRTPTTASTTRSSAEADEWWGTARVVGWWRAARRRTHASSPRLGAFSRDDDDGCCRASFNVFVQASASGGEPALAAFADTWTCACAKPFS